MSPVILIMNYYMLNSLCPNLFLIFCSLQIGKFYDF
jgi:hypothetical protein